MKVSTIESVDGFPLTAYCAGSGEEHIVLVNAPGMSIRFWTPVIGLLQDKYSLVGMEYRGFPQCERELDAGELAFDLHLDDLDRVVRAHGAERVHMVSWCLGAKVAWGYAHGHPERVRSIAAVGLAYTHKGSQADGPFSSAMLAIKRRLEEQPESIRSMISMMRRVGFVPDEAFFENVFREEEDGPVLSLMDMLDSESSMSTLAFYLLDDPVRLRNYLRLYEMFRSVRIADLFPHTRVAVTIVTGSKDRITPVNPWDREVLDTLPNVHYETVEGASHFLPVEFPHRLSRLLDAHARRAIADRTTV